MHQLAGRFLRSGVVLALVALLGCSSSSKQSTTDGGSGGATGAGGHAAGGAGGASGTPNDQSCQEIRLCVAACNDHDQPCADTCLSRGSASARSLYQAMAACTAPNCTGTDENTLYCACAQQCMDGPCVAQTEACIAGTTTDLVCFGYCVGQ